MITCPRCEVELQQGERAGQPVVACPRCGGLRLTVGSLGAIADGWRDAGPRPGEAAGVQVPLAEAREGLSCPACHEPMEAFNYAGDSGVILDRCRRCGDLWVDGGELELVGRWAAASRQGLEWDRNRLSADLRHEEVRQDALEQQDVRTSPSPSGTAAASPLID